MIAATGNLSFGNLRNSFGILSYINNQFYPTLTTSLYKIPGSAYFYGSQFLIEELTGGEITMNLPIDLFEGPYRGGALFARLRHVQAVPFDQDRFRETEQLPRPDHEHLGDRDPAYEPLHATVRQRAGRFCHYGADQAGGACVRAYHLQLVF